MLRNKLPRNPALADTPDEELAANVRMVVKELQGLRVELESRGYQSDVSYYESGRTEVEIYRETRENL